MARSVASDRSHTSARSRSASPTRSPGRAAAEPLRPPQSLKPIREWALAARRQAAGLACLAAALPIVLPPGLVWLGFNLTPLVPAGTRSDSRERSLSPASRRRDDVELVRVGCAGPPHYGASTSAGAGCYSTAWLPRHPLLKLLLPATPHPLPLCRCACRQPEWMVQTLRRQPSTRPCGAAPARCPSARGRAAR